MAKRPRGYLIFIAVMVLLALLGAALPVAGGLQHTSLPRIFPGEWLVAHRSL